VSFTWTGPLDQAVAKLAASVGYTFYTTAPANPQPLDVAIQVSSVPAWQVFATLGAEAGTRATVEVELSTPSARAGADPARTATTASAA
jgi:defect in organelle trafficking protein DotD